MTLLSTAMSKVDLVGLLCPRWPARGDHQASANGMFGTGERKLKAFLLAAGHGKRLRPLTDNTPKCLLPIRGVPMLQIWLEACHHYGIEEVLINVHAHAGAVHRFLGTHPHG